MAKSKPTPLKDEPMNSSDEICSKIVLNGGSPNEIEITNVRQR